jgi:hypothetical protein
MKTFAIAGVLALSVLAAGCSGCQPIAALTGDKPLAGQTVLDEKALLVAEAAQLTADRTAKQAVLSGLLTPGSPRAKQIDSYLALSHTGLRAARAAYNVGNATDFSTRLRSAQDALGTALSLIPKGA